MISKFDQYLQKLFLEAGPPPQEEEEAPPSPEGGEGAPAAPEGEAGMEVPEDGLEAELAPEKPVFPEEMELAKLAIRALSFHAEGKNTQQLKLKIDGQQIPFEMMSNYFEKTKKNFAVLGFVEWVIDRYEGQGSNWMRRQNGNIVSKIHKMNRELPEEQRLGSSDRLAWTRIVLNCLLQGTANFALNISEVNEKTIREIHNLLTQSFGHDSRGVFTGISDMRGPGTF